MRPPIRSALSLVCVLALPLFAGGCQAVSGMFGNLLGGQPGFPQPPAPPPAAKPPTVADRIVVLKSSRLLELMHDGKAFATFPVSLGPHPVGPKRQEGDGRTPEGDYVIDAKSMDTPYTRELHISYPNAQDVAQAAARGVNPGGAIFVHGLPDDFGPYDPPMWYRDWTEGCISVGNAAIVKIWNAVPVGTPIDIYP